MYAPIIIPTLNRFTHLERCINSLKSNSLASETELFISLDYPPSEKYFEGYKRIKTYLEELNDGFKEIHKFYQSENLGPEENANFLYKEVFKRFSVYIFSEDDNEFSPNFLDYINKGLEKFNKDETILTICGYHDERPWKCIKGNVMKINIFNAYGFATWKNKIEKCTEWICRDNFENFLHDKEFCNKLFHLSYKFYYTFIQSILTNPGDQNSVYISRTGDIRMIDYTATVYMLMNDMYTILPQTNMVRNWGSDGTGVNCAINDEYFPEEIEIDVNKHFEYVMPSVFEMNRFNQIIRYEDEYKKVAMQARCWRRIMCLFGLSFARKLNNVLYLFKKRSRKG